MEDRFWAKVEKTDTCWVWKACKSEHGYGLFGVSKGNMQKAHRVSYQMCKGIAPGDRDVGHECGNRACVNPSHLVLREDESMEDRFWGKVKKTETCWWWTAGCSSDGYGSFHVEVDGKRASRGAHAVAYELCIEKVPEGLEIDHLCRNRRCVNPAHLEPVPHKENVHRGEAGALCARRTHCPQGHTYDGVNTQGRRICSICRGVSSLRQSAVRRAKKQAKNVSP